MKTIFIALLFPLFAQADFQILYNLNGEQRLEGFGPGGSTSGEVVWRTDRDGPLPADAPIGYAERYNDGARPALRANVDLKAAKDAREAAAAAEVAAKAQEEAAFAALKAKLEAETATATEVRRAFKLLLKRIGQ